MYLPKFTASALGGLGLCLAVETRPTETASNWVRIPQVKHLPPASSEFRLATDTLALG